MMSAGRPFEYGTLTFKNCIIIEVTVKKIIQVHFKRHIGHTDVQLFASSLKLILGDDFNVFS